MNSGKNGYEKPAEEVRIADTIMGDDVEDVEAVKYAFKCCGKLLDEKGIETKSEGFLPAKDGASVELTCQKCGRIYKIYYDCDLNFYRINMAGTELSYERKKMIYLDGMCRCGNRYLRDDYSRQESRVHCVKITQPDVYSFHCPCGNTGVCAQVCTVDIYVRNGHFHVCGNSVCPVLGGGH